MLGKGVAEDIEDDEAQITNTDFDTRRRNNSGRENIMRHISWYTGQKVPKIFICTTLWHEEDFEMATLVRSVLKLMKAAKEKKEKAENSDKDEDYDYFDLEMHIFFDNVFEKDKKEKEQEEEQNPFEESQQEPEWSKGQSSHPKMAELSDHVLEPIFQFHQNSTLTPDQMPSRLLVAVRPRDTKFRESRL